MSDLTNQLLDAMELIADKKVAAARYDKTIQATIVSCVDAQAGKYKIKYQGNMFYAYSTDTSTTLNNGISVYVNVPESDFSKVKTIIGTVANQGNLSSSIITENQRYEEIGIDCIIDNIPKQPIKIDKDDTLLLYSKDSFMHEAISEVLQEEFILNVNKGKAFLLSATFTTNFEDVIANKEYSLVLTCKYKNDNKDSNSNIVYTFSSKNMTGNPLMYSMPTVQTRYFRFTEELEEISKIEIITSGFQPKDELLIKELKLIPCRYLDNNEITTRHLRIKRPWGSQFTDKKTNLIARAELVENGRLVTLDASKIKYLWFVEQPDATDYEDIIGTGWVFLNDTGSNSECTYQKTLFKQRFRNIKCVLLYQLNDIEENNSSAAYIATSQFFNNYPEYADDYFFIEKSVSRSRPFEKATSHNFSSGGEQIYLRALPIEPKVTSEQEKRQYKVNWVYKNINGDYIAESIADPDSQDPNNIIYIEAAKLNNVSREYIACYYDNTNFIGQQSFNIGFTSAENLDYDINIINGDITYMYNEYGLAPTAVATENKVIIKQLELSILDKKTSFLIFGEDIAKIAKDNITWYITANDKDRLVDFTDAITKDGKPNGKPVTVNIGGVEYIQAQGATLAYTLKEKYNSRANSNNIKVKVIYNNTAIWGTTNIQCYKIGDPGAIRGSYFIDITQVQPIDNGQRYEKLNEQPYFNSFHYGLNDKNELVAPSLFLQARVWDGQEWLKDENLVVSWEILNELPQLYSNEERNSLNTLISSFAKRGTSICEFIPKIIDNGASYLNDTILFSSDLFPLAQLIRVKLTITLNNEKKYFYRTIPIAVVMEAKNTIYNDKEKKRHLQIVDNSGFKYIKFDSAGQNPIYDANSPFEVGFIDEDKNLIQDQVNTYHTQWECINQAYTVIPQYIEYDGDEFLIEDLDLLRVKPRKEGENPFQFTAYVNNYLNISDYILYYSGVVCKITDNRISPISISENGEITGGVTEESLTEQAEEDSIIVAYKEIQKLRAEYLTKQEAILKSIEDADEETKQVLNQKLKDLETEYYGEPNGLIYKAVIAYNKLVSSLPENLIGYVYFPIDIYKSYLDNAVVNNWDGHMLDMGTDDGGNSYLMANMIGAGSKDEEDKFHGVLMGSIVSTHTDNPKNNKVQTGIMAYGKGQRTFFLNAEDGSAMFGTGEDSCIKIVPGADAIIKGAGMEISFSASNPYINFNNGVFSVDRDGHLIAQDADIQGHIEAGGWSAEGDNAEFRPPIGAVLNIGPNKDKSGNVKDIDFNLEARARIGEMDDYDNVYDFVQINYQEFEFGRANFSKEPKDGIYDRELITGLSYRDGELRIKGTIYADAGTIGGWSITDDAIVSANRELILYSDGHVIGLGGSDEDTDFIDINNSTITWNSMSNKTNYDSQLSFDDWKQQWRNDKENKEGRQTKASISTENGCLSMSSSSAVNISGSTSASLSASGTSMGVYSNDTDRVFGMSISSPPTGVDNGMPETIATLAGVMSKVEDPSATNPPKEDTETPKDTETSNNTNTDNEEPPEKDKVANTEKYMGFLALNSTYDDSITNMPSTEEHIYTGIHVLERNNIPDPYMMQYNTEPPPQDDTQQEDSNNSDTTNNQAKATNTDADNDPVYQKEGYYVKPIEQDKIRREFLIIEEVKDENGNACNPRKYRTVPVSLSEAIQFWYLHRNDLKTEHLGDIENDQFGNLEFWVEYFTSGVKKEFETFVSEKDKCVESGKGKYTKTSKFKRTWMTYRPSDEGYLAPTTYAVVGIPPEKAVMEKVEKKVDPNKKDEGRGESYCIKEFYQEGVVLNNKINSEEAAKYGVSEKSGKLEYYINVNPQGQVHEIIFPNKKQMSLQGFDSILAPNCPYNKKKE